MKRTSYGVLYLLTLLTATVWPIFTAQAQQGKNATIFGSVVDPKGSIFHLEGKDIAPSRWGEGALTEATLKGGTVQTNGKDVWFEDLQGTRKWSTNVPKDTTLQIVANTEDVVFFVNSAELDSIPRQDYVYRVEANSGKWLSNIRYWGQAKDSENVVVRSVSGKGNLVAVLFNVFNSNQDGTERMVSRSVGVFTDTSDTQQWEAEIAVDPQISPPGRVLLLAASYPNFADSSVNVFNWQDDSLLVCPDETGPLESYDRQGGKKKWTVDRPWEFQRGFIGPSVFSDFVGRFGDGDSFMDKEKIDASKRDIFAKQYVGQIIAGPVGVSTREGFGYSRTRYLFAVTLAKRAAYSGYTGDCIVYEMDSDGDILTRTPLPQYLIGGSQKLFSDSVVWATKNRGLMRLRSSKDRITFGPGGPDATGEIAWFFQTPQDKEHWLATDAARPLVTYDDQYAYQIVDGWYVDQPDSKLITFPISRVDLRTGSRSECKLEIAVKSPVKRPSTNYQSSGNSMHQFGPGEIGITGLKRTRRGLRVQLATEEAIGYIEFPIEME